MPKIYNKHHGGAPADAAYIGRPSKWGNPFVIGKDGTRGEVITKYETWLMANKPLLRQIGELRGKSLVCFCAPQACHGDVLVRIAARELEHGEKEKGRDLQFAGPVQEIPRGARIAIAGGAEHHDIAHVSAALDRVRAKYPAMVMLHKNGPPGAVAWAKSNDISNVAINSVETMFAAKPIGVIAFSGSRDDRKTIEQREDLAKKARARGVPVWNFDLDRQRAIALAKDIAREATRIEAAKPHERYVGPVIGKTETHILQEIAARSGLVILHDRRALNADKALTRAIVEIAYPHGRAGLVRDIAPESQASRSHDRHGTREIDHGQDLEK